MLPTLSFPLVLLALLAAPAMAAPIDTLSSIQCHCLTFYTYSPPATCTLPHSQNLSWNAAQSFASANKLDITFASRTAVSRVLEVERPVPTSVLMSLYGGLVRGGGRRTEVGSRVVCGSWDEVTKKYVSEVPETEAARSSIAQGSVRNGKCDGLLSEVVGMLVLFLVLYAVGEYVWARVFPSQGSIQLDGEEKHLLALTESGCVCSPTVDEKRPACEPAAHTTAS